MPIDWSFPQDLLSLEGVGERKIPRLDGVRQTITVQNILADLAVRPGVLLADEVGMGKTYVAMATIASAIVSMSGKHYPIVVMVPPGLRKKWQRDWEQFKTRCVRDGRLDWIRHREAKRPTDFFKLLDDQVGVRPHIIFITTGCFTQGLEDAWVKLAMIRLARSHTRLTETEKTRAYRWSADLVRQSSNTKLSDAVVQKLLNTNVSEWKRILVGENILAPNDDDPIPASLQETDAKGNIKWDPMCQILRELPAWRPDAVSPERRAQVKKAFHSECRAIYEQWLNQAEWQSPLLVLDESHHAKNDATRLARFFRDESNDESKADVALLKNRFSRMLFLSATPFQLGHEELIRVLRSFEAVDWRSESAPNGTPGDFQNSMTKLKDALGDNRGAARQFDKLWGKLRQEEIVDVNSETTENEQVLRWWRRVSEPPHEPWATPLVKAYADCVSTKLYAEELLQPWLIRHNHAPYLGESTDVPRRNVLVGRAINSSNGHSFANTTEGIAIEKDALLPFLITASVQGHLAQYSKTRAFFAEGLASSYEAFHDTRKNRITAKDSDDGLDSVNEDSNRTHQTRWYEQKIAEMIPSKESSPLKLRMHPKISATITRAVDLWFSGEKVLVFCFYIQTVHALSAHLRKEVDQRIMQVAGTKLGLDPLRQREDIRRFISRIIRRLLDPTSPFQREITITLHKLLDSYPILEKYRKRILKVLLAYFRSPSFVVRYLPLEDSSFHAALNGDDDVQPGIGALRYALQEGRDSSNQTYLERVTQFLEFASELAERAQHQLTTEGELNSDESEDPLEEYLAAASLSCRPRRSEDMDKDDDDTDEEDDATDESDDNSYRVPPLVRKIYGETKQTVRDRLMLAFNSPLFPEILVSSSVMGEGVDLHRFCRYVIHHDLCWNPSTLEQRTGRLDRVNCKAERCHLPITVYEPFLAGSADEKMFRVVRDRERWFQIVMGQKFEFDESTSDTFASRVPLPLEVARTLTFNLSR